MNSSKLLNLLCLILIINSLSGCFISKPFHPQDKANKRQLKQLPESETVFIAKYTGTQTGTQIYFRKDSLFILETQTAFGWEQYNGRYNQSNDANTFSLTYLNNYSAKWNYITIDRDKALLKIALNDTVSAKIKTFRVVKNLINE